MNALDSFVKRNHMEQVKFRVGIDKVSSDGLTNTHGLARGVA